MCAIFSQMLYNIHIVICYSDRHINLCILFYRLNPIYFSSICFWSSKFPRDEIFVEKNQVKYVLNFTKALKVFVKYLFRYSIKYLKSKVSGDFRKYSIHIYFIILTVFSTSCSTYK